MSVYKVKEKGFNAWVERFFKNKPDAFVVGLIGGSFIGAVILNPAFVYFFGG